MLTPFFCRPIAAMELKALRHLLFLSSVLGTVLLKRQFLIRTWSYSTFSGTLSPFNRKFLYLAPLSCSLLDSPKNHNGTFFCIIGIPPFVSIITNDSQGLVHVYFREACRGHIIGIPHWVSGDASDFTAKT